MAKPPYGLKLIAESRKLKAESRKPKAESRKPKAERRKPKAESRKPKADYLNCEPTDKHKKLDYPANFIN